MCKYSGFKIVVINIGSIQRKLLSHLWLETEQQQQRSRRLVYTTTVIQLEKTNKYLLFKTSSLCLTGGSEPVLLKQSVSSRGSILLGKVVAIKEAL